MRLAVLAIAASLLAAACSVTDDVQTDLETTDQLNLPSAQTAETLVEVLRTAKPEMWSSLTDDEILEAAMGMCLGTALFSSGRTMLSEMSSRETQQSNAAMSYMTLAAMELTRFCPTDEQQRIIGEFMDAWTLENPTETLLSTNTSDAADSFEPPAVSPQDEAFADVLRSRDPDRVWVGVEDWEIAELAAGFCRIADQVANLSEQESSGVDRSTRGQYFIGSIMDSNAPPPTLIRNGALLGALVINDPAMCSTSALGVLIDGMDWMFENYG